MSPGYQKRGEPSHASCLRGEPAAYRQSRVGIPGSNPPPMLPSTYQNRNYPNASTMSKAGTHLPSTASNFGLYSQAHARTSKPVAAEPEDDFVGGGSASVAQTPSQANGIIPKGTTTNSKPQLLDQQGIVNSMTKLSVNSVPNPDSVVKGRCMKWERPNPSTNSKVSKCNPRSDRPYPKPITSEYSMSYKRTAHQVPIEQAGFRQYVPFLRAEFKIGMIVRRNYHESDYIEPPAFTPGSRASQTSTLVTTQGGTRGYREHRSNGDFGPIYSENRYFIVVSLCSVTYYAIPLYTHEKHGLARIAESQKGDWVSVRDHRQPNGCQQQSEHAPLCTTVMNPDAKILNPVTAAWLPYAVPIRYSVPVAYQGRLDLASTVRVRSLFLTYLGGEK